MSSTPFRDTARKIAKAKDYYTMSWESERARSHGWWKNLVEYGAWQGPPGGGRVAPPAPEALEGIARLFGTTVERVSAMIASDWYGVRPDTDLSARVLSLGPVLDRLADSDAELVEVLARRLVESGASEPGPQAG